MQKGSRLSHNSPSLTRSYSETSERFHDRGSSVDVDKYNLEGADLKTRFPNVDEAKLLRKIDIRVVPVLCIMYLLAFLDRYVLV